VDCLKSIQETDPVPPGKLKRPLYRKRFKTTLPLGVPGVIGVTGKPRSGKDVVADYLEAHFVDVARVNFSDPIIEEVNSWLSNSGHQITQGNKSHMTYRKLLQAWGMARREAEPDYWTRQLSLQIKALQDGGIKLVLVCGVRTPSDLELVENLGGSCWYILRPGNDYQAKHDIETALDGIDPSRFTYIENPSEGNLAPYEDNIREALLYYEHGR